MYMYRYVHAAFSRANSSFAPESQVDFFFLTFSDNRRLLRKFVSIVFARCSQREVTDFAGFVRWLLFARNFPSSMFDVCYTAVANDACCWSI